MLGMSWWEIAGFVTGAVSVWLYAREHLAAWPVGLASSGCWLVLFWSSQLYLDAALQVVYLALGVAGWYWWLRGGPQRAQLPVRRAGRRQALVLTGIGLCGTLALWPLMVAVSDALPLPDAATTVLSLIAQYLLSRKLLGNWWCWITVDVAYLVMYAAKGLYLTAALQPLFIAMCILGLRGWRATLARTATGATQAQHETAARVTTTAPVRIGGAQ